MAEDGRGPSIWDTFAARPRDRARRRGRLGGLRLLPPLRGGPGPGGRHGRRVVPLLDRVAADRARRASAGSRRRGLDYYDRLVDAALARGVAPTATLYHWDLPQPLEDRDGWLNRDTAEAFADYAAVVHDRLGDRVHVWATHNEPWCAAYLGYAAGVHAPGRREGGSGPPRRAPPPARARPGRRAAPRGRRHRRGHRAQPGAVLARGPLGRRRGGGHRRPRRAPQPAVARPARRRRVRRPAARRGARAGRPRSGPGRRPRPRPRLGRLAGRQLLHAVPHRGPRRRRRGRTPRRRPTRAPGPCRSSSASRAPTSAGRSTPPGSRRSWSTPIGVPACPSWSPRTARPTRTTRSTRTPGTVDDQDRIAYLREHIAATLRAREAGADVRAYIVWTLLDNFEWAEGYTKTFGIVHVDPRDQTRTPKASFHWLAEHIDNSTADLAVTP